MKIPKVEWSIIRMWDVCDEDWRMEAHTDQWWGVRVKCPHGEWRAPSDNMADLGRAFERVAVKVEAEHADAVARAKGGGWMHACWKVNHSVWAGAGVPCPFCGKEG